MEYSSSSSVGNPPSDVTLMEKCAPQRPTANGHLEKPLRIGNTVKRKKNVVKPTAYDDERTTSSSPSSDRIRFGALRRRNSKPLLDISRRPKLCAWCNDVEAVALPLGMSIATLFAQVLDKNNKAWEKIPADHLSTMCCSAVRESLSNVFGDKFDSFSNNFEKSFRSTLKTVSLINEHCQKDEYPPPIKNNYLQIDTASSHVDEVVKNSVINSDAQSHISGQDCAVVDVEDERNHSVDNYLVELDSQLIRTSSSLPGTSEQLSTIEKCVMEQTRLNDLKTVEIGLTMRRLRLKEAQLALSYDSNYLQRSKIAMGVSKASFQAEKFKTQVEETRHSELLKKILDCLVAGLFIMSTLLLYGAYVFSYKRISDATASCNNLFEESTSWWMPKKVTSFNSGLSILRCQVQVISRMVFGMLMIIAIAYLLLQRSGGTQQTMPVTFILLLLGVVCGFAGKLCVDTLGGNGLLWLFYWELLCLLNFLSVVFTPTLFGLLYGSVGVKQGQKGNLVVPFWIRRFIYFGMQLVVMPLCCGLLPFASLGEWIFSAFSLSSIADMEDRF